MSGIILFQDNTIAELENVLEQLDGPDVQIGRTKGLGRCVAKIDGEWFRHVLFYFVFSDILRISRF